MDQQPDRRFPTVEEFARRVQGTRRRLAERRAQAPAVPPLADVATPPGSPLARRQEATIHELETMVEELGVATEELRHQQEELVEARGDNERQRARYRDLFDFAPDAYLVTDAAGIVREANRAACAMLAVSERSLIGKPLAAYIDTADRRGFRTLLSELPVRGYSGERPFVVRPREGGPLPAGVTAASTHGSGEIRWLLRDISERVRAHEHLSALNAELEARVANRTVALRAALDSERAAHARAVEDDQLKARLLALLSHEIRTPLQTLVGYTELLERELHGPLTDAQRRDLHRMQRSQEHMLAVVNSVLDYVRLRHGSLELELVPVGLAELVEGVAQMLHPQLAARQVVLDRGRIDGECRAMADAERLRQVLINLVANAIKFSEPGGVVAIGCEETPGSVALHVIDHGCGIPAERLDAIFEPFVQLAPERGGSGLGLSISRDLVRAMGGALSAESRLGEGSVFTVRLRR